MSEKKDPLLKDHIYDGIQEYDNPLPQWWLWTFLGAIIYSFLYVLHYHTSTHILIEDEYQKEVAQIQVKQGGNKPEISEEILNAAAIDPSQLERGKGLFQNRCVACHGSEGGGGIGPNLCDKNWIHGKGKVHDIFAVVQNGVLDKGMPAWATMLGPDEIVQVSAFVASLKGSKPANPKAPQGMKVD
jgi:cytochrome c oxidase cbb3-type subunit III